MKKLMYLGLGLAMLNLTSCKKGENDPGMSLKGRKGRLAGTWGLTSSTENSTTTNDGNTSSSDRTEDGATYTSTYTDSEGVKSVSTGTATKEITFEKDGTFTMTTVTSHLTSQYDGGDVYTIEDPTTDTWTMSGQWSFISKNKDGEYKNKERVALTGLSSSNTNSDSDANKFNSVWTGSGDQGVDMVLELDMLKSKELGLKSSSTSTETPNDSDNKPTTWTSDEESTWEKK